MGRRRRFLTAGVVVALIVGALAVGAVHESASSETQVSSPDAVYVQQVYRDLLGRSADSAGLSYWTAELDSGVPRSATAWAMVSGDEYRRDVISGMYREFLGRNPDAGGLNYWVGQVAGGMTFEWFESYLISSDEYYGSSAKGKGDSTDFVRSMYGDVLGRAVDAAGLDYFDSSLDSGTPRAQVVAAVVFSSEHLDSTVNGYYTQFLHRDVDASGEAYWVGQLQAGARDEQIIALIIGSDEYFTLVTATAPPTTTAATTTPTTTGSGDPRAQTGQWSAPVNYGMTAGIMQHAVLIPGSSKILYFEDGAGTYILDPNAGTIKAEAAGSNLFCAGQTVLADGRIMTLGGDLNGQPEVGTPNTNIYNPATDSWSAAAGMNYLRWYPTATKLSDGRILASSGTASGVAQTIPEVYNPGNNTWTALPSANHYLPSYPFMFVLPDGRIVNVGGFTAPSDIETLNTTTWTWSVVDGSVTDAGSAAMYLPGKILRAGSYGFPGTASQVSSAKAYVLDMTQPNPKLRQVASMANPRAFLNMTVLPDDNVLVTGGNRNHQIYDSGAGATLQAEMWSPTTEQWTTLASNQRPRYYHSTAVLLPDGRVVIGGGWGTTPTSDGKEHSYEIYSPPYLFKGPRPTIASAPTAVGYGASFNIATPDAAGISKAVLIAPSAVTHNFNENARYVPLDFTAGAGTITATAPANGNWAPPGPYMLFLVNSNGVPSVASWINVG